MARGAVRYRSQCALGKGHSNRTLIPRLLQRRTVTFCSLQFPSNGPCKRAASAAKGINLHRSLQLASITFRVP